MLKRPLRVPRATYRCQFNNQFTFAHLRELIPYLAELGISEVYASPVFRASPGSSHGYDVVDHNEISPDLGGRPGLDALTEQLREHNIGLILDFVPNHMGINGLWNDWWLDVLESGQNSRYAQYFDIEWNPRLERLTDKVLVPMLPDYYGAVLESGRLQLRFLGGAFSIEHYSSHFPIRPGTYPMILERLAERLPAGSAERGRLEEISQWFADLPRDTQEAGGASLEEREGLLRERKQALSAYLEEFTIAREQLDLLLVEINGDVGRPASFDALHELLEKQHYRLTFWKAGAHEVNYRRFFAVDTLVGLRMEELPVFEHSHELLAELVTEGCVTGVRIDHIDGLWNPAEYLRRLASLARQAKPETFPLYTLVEKIVEPGEEISAEWAIHGTSGYEYIYALIGLFLDKGKEKEWTRIYGEFTGVVESTKDLTYQDKKFILQEIFPNAVANLTVELDGLIERDRRWRDLTMHDVGVALGEIIACLQVYRTYRVFGEKMRPEEAHFIREALHEARERNRSLDPVPFNFLADVITGEYPPDNAPEEFKHALQEWVCKLQQATGAAMAKSVEDTHFYRYVRMFATNEVGSQPCNFGQDLAEFHAGNEKRQARCPFSMLTTSTHDTKMSEDVRARLFALAEMPQEWERWLAAWRKVNAVFKTTIDGRQAPDANEEYLLYQVLLGAWPLDFEAEAGDFADRLRAYLRKAISEAKINTNWVHPHDHWLVACDRFINGILSAAERGRFREQIAPVAQLIAENGMVFSLAQTALKLTCPGVPDIYQGNELWDFSLVDPDNRRPVDYGRRRELLAGLAERSSADLMENWRDGAIKLRVTHALLKLREQRPGIFSDGGYAPIAAEGGEGHRLVGFTRSHQGETLLVLVPRSLHGLSFPFLGSCWEGTTLKAPHIGTWRNLLTGAELPTREDGTLAVNELLAELPLCVLINN